MKRPLPDRLPELRDAGLLLRELQEIDIPAWFARATDVESADLAGDPVPASIDLGRPWLQRQRDALHQRKGLRWAIVPPTADEPEVMCRHPRARVAAQAARR